MLNEQLGGVLCAACGVTKPGGVLTRGFDDEHEEEHGVRVVDIEQQADDYAEDAPLAGGALLARFVPIPEKKRGRKSGVRVRPRRIEVHVHGKRAGPPNGDSGEKGPKLADVLARETERKKQTEKTIQRGGQGHGHAVGRGKSVGGNVRAEGARKQHAGVRDQQKRSPENGGTDGEVIFEMPGARPEDTQRLAVLVQARFAKAGVGALIVVLKIETVLDERR